MTASRRSVLACLMALAACTTVPPPARPSVSPNASSPARSPNPAPGFAAARVAETVRILAANGPRVATSPSFVRAATFVEDALREHGYRVRRQVFHVPGGVTNRVAVPEGDSFNVIAEPADFDSAKPHVVIGAHLDTVPQAPGAVDNAAGIGIMLELARLAASDETPLPVVFVAFGAEESRVPGGGLRGSREYVAALRGAERSAVGYMVAIDRIGTGSRVPVCVSRSSARPTARRLLRAAQRAGVPAHECTNGSSDHAPFSAAGIPAVRIGPDTYAEYHTARDVPAIFVPAQAGRAGALLWEALRSGV
jgi:Zn-dependent M28 family amino/carboxypeptidase